jgi:hypothetical protein
MRPRPTVGVCSATRGGEDGRSGEHRPGCRAGRGFSDRRQSSPEQVRNNAKSTRIQIGLRDKAVAFGWCDPVTIVDDLGTSAGGFALRAGFQHMTAEVSLGDIGIILCFEASRLSRNSND